MVSGAALPAAAAQRLLGNKGIALLLYSYIPSGGLTPAALVAAAAAQTGLGAQLSTALPLSFTESATSVGGPACAYFTTDRINRVD